MRKLTADEKKAVGDVKALISEYRAKIESITLVRDDFDLEPRMLEGETVTGYACSLQVDPRDVALILLDYDYPVFAILGEKAPEAMWIALADKFGLKSVSDFDL